MLTSERIPQPWEIRPSMVVDATASAIEHVLETGRVTSPALELLTLGAGVVHDLKEESLERMTSYTNGLTTEDMADMQTIAVETIVDVAKLEIAETEAFTRNLEMTQRFLGRLSTTFSDQGY